MADVAIAHDQFVVLGGAERVALEMARALDAPIFAGAVDEEIVPEDVEVVEVFDSRVGQRAMRSHYLVQDAYQMVAWQHCPELYEYETVVLNKTNPAWFVPRDTQKTVWYVHSTPRGAYDMFHERGASVLSRLIKMGIRAFYSPNTRYADAWACNSELVQRRLERYWDVPRSESNVIYPPVDVSEFEPSDGGEYFFTVSRLEDHKNVDQIVRACIQADVELVVAGDGPERERLEELAAGHPNVTIAGYVSEAEKREHLRNAKATIFAADNEDFGIVPIESFAAGTPVLGVQDGFTEHQIVEPKNGYLFPSEGGHLRETIRRFERDGVAWSAAEIHAFSQQFSTPRFHQRIRDLVDRTVEEHSVDADLQYPRIKRAPGQPTSLADGGDK